LVTPILPTWQGICCLNTPGTPALLTDLGLMSGIQQLEELAVVR